MRKHGFALSAVAAAMASALLAISSSAYVEEVKDKHVGFTSDKSSWKVSVEMDHNDLINDGAKFEVVVELTGDIDKYKKEKEQGYYDSDDDMVREFVDFQGNIAVGATEWTEFGYQTLEFAAGDDKNATVEPLGNNRYLISADLTEKKLVAPNYGSSLSLAEWGNKSDAYCLKVIEMYYYDANGRTLFYYDSKGNVDYNHASRTGEAPVVEEETAAVTETPGDKPAETTAATTAAAKSNQPGKAQAVAADAVTNSGDSTLLIVGISAGAVILLLIVVIIIYVKKKKN